MLFLMILLAWWSRCIFLDVDNLKHGRGGEYVQASEVVVVFISHGYFQSVRAPYGRSGTVVPERDEHIPSPA